MKQRDFLDKKAVLFDLDGTVIDSSEGIFNALKYMFKKISMEVTDEEKLFDFIGPSIAATLRIDYDFADDQADEAVDIYREYYGTKGLLECKPYEGMENLLKGLKANGKMVALATKKPELYAKQIIQNLGFNQYFDVVCGAAQEENCNTKSHIIERAIKLLGVSKNTAVMVGDTKYDVIGSNEIEVECIGVLYGFGSEEEMQEQNVTAIAKDMKALTTMLLNKNNGSRD